MTTDDRKSSRLTRTAGRRNPRLAVAVAVLLAGGALAAGCAPALPDPAQVELADNAELGALEQTLRDRIGSGREPDALLLLSRVRLRQGAGAEALLLIQEASRRAPFRADLLHALGDVYLASGERFRALLAYSQAVAVDPERLESYVALGRLQHHLRRYEAARETLTRAIHLEPLYVDARLALAALLLDLGEPAAAEIEIQAAVGVQPESDRVRRAQVRVLEALGRLEEARRIAEAGLAGRPEDARWLAILLRIQHSREDWPAVAALWPRIAEPDAAQLLIRVDWLAATGEAEATARLRAELEQRFPRDPLVLVAAARGLLAQQGPEAALARLQAAVEADPNHAPAHYWRAVAQYRLGRKLEGDLALNRGEALVGAAPGPGAQDDEAGKQVSGPAPLRAALARLRTRRLLADGQVEAAARALERVREWAAEQPETRLLEAELHTLTGQWIEAERILRELPDTQAGVRYARARLGYLQGHYRSALDEIAAVTGQPTSTWEAIYLETAILGRMGRIPEALTHLAPYLEDGASARPEFYRLAGDLHDRAGDLAAAGAAYAGGLRLFPRDPDLIEGFSRVAVARGQWREARTRLETGIETANVHRPLLLERLARTYRELGETERANALRMQYLDAVDPVLREPGGAGTTSVLYGLQHAAALTLAEGG